MEKKLVTTALIQKACEQLNLAFRFVTQNKTVIKIETNQHHHYIINSNFGLLDSTTAQLCLDKAYQYEILKEVIAIPKTYSYLDPFSKYAPFALFQNHQKIQGDIKQKLSFPLVIKKNSGTEGENVFLCENETQLTKALQTVFNQNHHLYDHVVLAQEKIVFSNEYRAIFYKKKLKLLYKKDISHASFNGNLSPLHFDGAQAVDIDDQELFDQLTHFISPVFEKMNLPYAGFDIVEDDHGEFWLIEINAVPGYAYYLEHNSEKKVLSLFKEMLLDISRNKSGLI